MFQCAYLQKTTTPPPPIPPQKKEQQKKQKNNNKQKQTPQTPPNKTKKHFIMLLFQFLILVFFSLQGILMFLQNLPTRHWNNKEISEIMAEAYKLKYMFADAPNHLMKKS